MSNKTVFSMRRGVVAGLGLAMGVGGVLQGRAAIDVSPVGLIQSQVNLMGEIDFEPIVSPPSNLGTFNIQLNPSAALQANVPALQAFERAAAMWEHYISDPITIVIDADFSDLGGGGIIGSASSTAFSSSNYDAIMGIIRSDEAAEALVHPVVASIPNAAQTSFALPAGITWSGSIAANSAVWKALGLGGSIPGGPLGTDGTIRFNTQFSFDFDNSNGITPGTMDFETVAAHEIGHVLGFTSVVDSVDFALDQGTTGAVTPRVLDLFRFENGSANDPASLSDFATDQRSLMPGVDAIFDQVSGEFGTADEAQFSTGVTQGDGQQASHWKDSLGLGILDPTLAFGEISPITNLDLVAFDVIGYDITPIPEPTTYALFAGLSAMGFVVWRRRFQALS